MFTMRTCDTPTAKIPIISAYVLHAFSSSIPIFSFSEAPSYENTFQDSTILPNVPSSSLEPLNIYSLHPTLALTAINYPLRNITRSSGFYSSLQTKTNRAFTFKGNLPYPLPFPPINSLSFSKGFSVDLERVPFHGWCFNVCDDYHGCQWECRGDQ